MQTVFSYLSADGRRNITMKKIYLAGGIVAADGKQRTNLSNIAKCLRNKGLEVFSPIEHKIPDGENMPNRDWCKAVFEMDLKAINEADGIVMCYNGTEAKGQNGTMWECGYAAAKGIPVIVVFMTDGNTSSLMVSNSVHCFVKGLRGLRRYDFNKMRKNTYYVYSH